MSEGNKHLGNKLVFSVTLFIEALILLICAYQPASAFNNRENAVVKAVREISPAVVNISSEFEVQKRPFSGFDPFFDSFFRDFFDPGFDRRYKRNSLGSGVIIDGKRGFILTNAHVIERAGTITVILKDKRELEAHIVGADHDSDLAVLRISSENSLPAIQMGSSEDLMIGETVIAIGNPFGFSNTVTTGVISALNRSIRTDDRVYHDFIQTDASINPGNSGGPLLNINGELIGINTAIYAKAQGIGFAIPINKAKKIISDLIQYGEVVQPWIGVIIQDIDARLAQYLKMSGNMGVLVREVEPSSPAQKAGILDGDIIISVQASDIGSSEDFHMKMRGFAAGDIVKMQILRDGRKKTVRVKAAVFPAEQAQELAYNLLGIKVENLSANRTWKRKRGRADVKEGVVISDIRGQSYLASIGVSPGDIIRQIDQITIKNVRDFEKAVVKYRNKASVVILLQRGDRGYYITVRL
ncbi:MAG: Do family serine endopeptidase [Desulfobacteraceae bacterium]|nr:Do family serine endopeptidase [Desulfobacteraceae bacterium]